MARARGRDEIRYAQRTDCLVRRCFMKDSPSLLLVWQPPFQFCWSEWGGAPGTSRLLHLHLRHPDIVAQPPDTLPICILWLPVTELGLIPHAHMPFAEG